MPKTHGWGAGMVCLLVVPASARASLEASLGKSGLVVKSVATEAAAVAALKREPFAVAIVAHTIGPSAISSILTCARQGHPEVPVFILGSTSTVEEAVDAMRRGAADYLPTPLDVQVLLLRLQQIVEARRDAAREAVTSARSPELSGLIGSSPSMLRVYRTIEKITRYKTNVLLLGESGTGKELIARALHGRGLRRQQLFVPLNCATLGRELLENELFGHERGAFTGANERKKGLFELADGGTLFLDEIAEMDPATQAKLLRVLERNEFRRVGGTDKIKVDLSVIAATHRNLPDLIASNRFRDDLYYRLKVVTLVVPSLRERKEDIPALIDFFIADFNRRHNGKIKGISPQLLKRFMDYDWPGNVRELKNAVESAAILAADQTIDADGFDMPLAMPAAPRPAPSASVPPARDANASAVDAASVGSAASRPAPSASVPAARDADAEELRIPLTSSLAEAERSLILAHIRRGATKREAARPSARRRARWGSACGPSTRSCASSACRGADARAATHGTARAWRCAREVQLVPWQQFFVLQELDWQIDQLRAELELATRLGDHTTAHLGSEIARARRDSELVEAQLLQREEQRARAAALVAGPTLTHYERLRAHLKTRPWVLHLSSDSCPACNLVLPSKVVSDARRTGQPCPCPSCKRLLIWRRAGAAGTDC